MTRTLTLSSILLFTGLVNAQPTLTYTSNAPVQGQAYTLHYGPYVSEGAAGAAQTWDLSTLTTDSTALITLVDPASTTNGASFPNATVAETGAAAIMYYRWDPDGMYLTGSDAAGLLIPYTNEAQYLSLPCTFGTTWTDDAVAEFTVQGFDVSRNATIDGEADGYGTLIMPTWTANNVLRVHWHEETLDSTPLFNLESVYDSYLYFVEGQSFPIVQLVHSELTFLGQTTVVEQVQWVDALSTDADERTAGTTDLGLYPNPAHDQLTVSLPADLKGTVHLTVADAQGRTVNAQRTTALSGNGPVDISALSAGLYMLTATDASGTSATRRFIVE